MRIITNINVLTREIIGAAIEVHKGEALAAYYRIDLVVEGLVVVELKSAEHVLAVHKFQVLTYLRLTECPLGLLINFNVPKLTDALLAW